jgi:hypothetical protein
MHINREECKAASTIDDRRTMWLGPMLSLRLSTCENLSGPNGAARGSYHDRSNVACGHAVMLKFMVYDRKQQHSIQKHIGAKQEIELRRDDKSPTSPF